MFLERPLEIVQPLINQEVAESQTITLECEVSKHGVKANWTKNGKEVVPGGRTEIRVDGTKHVLTITGADLSDQAQYKVAFADISSAAEVTVAGALTLIYFKF